MMDNPATAMVGPPPGERPASPSSGIGASTGTGSGGGGGVARVQFRVRCESLGHGEAVYLAPQIVDDDASSGSGGGGGGAGVDRSGGGEDGKKMEQKDQQPRLIPMYTTGTRYPWYSTGRPVSLSLPDGPLGAGGGGPVQPIPVPAGAGAGGLPPAGPGRMGLPLTSGGGVGMTRPTPSSRQQQQQQEEQEASTSSSAAPPSSSAAAQFFHYRYAIYRAGVFHRWEDPTDGPADGTYDVDGDEAMADNDASTAPAAAAAGSDHQQQQQQQQSPRFHRLPLRLLTKDELYQLSDVLGQPSHQPELEHIRVPTLGGHGTSSSVASLHSRHDSRSRSSMGNLGGGGGSTPGSSQHNLLERRDSQNKDTAGGGGGSKAVGFAPQPLPYHSSHGGTPASKAGAGAGAGGGGGFKSSTNTKQVHLNSTDGLVVASAFLPVHLQRTETPHSTNPNAPPQVSWSADWDYEALLSMQTHLRVTRVGVVKWRGWHGNVGKDGSPSKGVPIEERHLVERCLEQFNCIPVWIEPRLFGEMYNGFCKGVLWPILHNVTSVYSGRHGDSSSVPSQSASGSSGDGSAQARAVSPDSFSEYTMDDVSPGAIHGDGGREAALWSAYTAVNREFANAIIQCFNEGDLIWIHGFHLLILPSFLTRRIPMAKIGIFLHTPFPSSEIFRTVWCREDLLRGMLNADQVGFHLFEYARHFLTCCRRLLGLNYGMIPDESGGHNLAIDYNGRHVTVTSIHAGVEPPVLNQILQHSSTMERAFTIRNQFRGKVIFCAIDRMESLKGIPLKMLGIERFLNRCPEWVGKLVLVQVGISAFERGDDYFRTKAEVLSMVENINKKWPGTVQFQECAESEMRLQQRMALLRAADVVMVTPIRDGLNLIPLEFTVAHQDALTEQGRMDNRPCRGLCILSEFSSCTRVMRGALHINPWKISEIANAFHQALQMSTDERMRRISCASEFVTRVTTQRWALAVMLDLKGVFKSVDPGQYAGAGLGLGFRLLGMDTGFVSLDITQVAKKYKNARSRLILLDYGGTILSNDNSDSLTRFQMVKQTRAPTMPTQRLISTLKDLCADKRNIVFVVSGKERHSLTRGLSDIPNLGLAAEHGMFVSWPTAKTSSKRRWETIVPDQDNSWRAIAITIMEVYTSRTHGSYIEETEMKVLWQYRDADPEFGYLQSRELEDHLANVLRSFSVDILHGGVEEGGYVEVRPKGVNKGVVGMHIIKNAPKLNNSAKIDFALALGDDHCDEPMLSVMRQIGRRAVEARAREPLAPLPATITQVDVSPCDQFISSGISMFTCTVGKKPSAAANYVNDVDEVHELLESMVKVATRDHKYFSSTDLPALNTDHSSPAVMGSKHDSWLTPVSGAPALGGAGGFQRSMSLGDFNQSNSTDLRSSAPVKISANLNEFLGTIEDEEDEEDIFF